MMPGSIDRTLFADHDELLERAWEAYRTTNPRPRLFPAGVIKYHSFMESRIDRDQRVINWFLSRSLEIVN